MTADHPTPAGRRDRGAESGPERRPTAERFRHLFDRDPVQGELEAFRSAHEALVLGIPARVRRSAARVIARV